MEKHVILIADDVEINRNMLSFIFEEQYKILEAADGVETIEFLEKYNDTLSLIFLDLIMPNKSGLDVLEYMFEKGYMNTIPVIMITGEATADSEVKAYEYGVSDIIYKPFDSKVVMRRAQNIIELFQNRMDIERKLEKRTRQLQESKEKLDRKSVV